MVPEMFIVLSILQLGISSLVRFNKSDIVFEKLKLYHADLLKCDQNPLTNCYYIHVRNKSTTKEHHFRVDNFFILVDEIADLQKHAERLSEDPQFDSTSRVHFILVNQVTEKNFLLDTMEFIWSRHISKFILVFVMKEYQVYSYNPFKRKLKKFSNFAKSCKPFFNDKTLNLHGNPIRAAIYQKQPYAQYENGDWSGREVWILKQFAKFLNASIELVYDKKFDNDYVIHEFLYTNRADFIIIRSFKNLLLTQNTSASYPYGIDHKVVVVAAPKRILKFPHLTSLTDSYVAIFGALACIAMVITVNLVAQNRTLADFSGSCLDLLGTAIGYSINKFRRFNGVLSLLFIVWIFAFIIINTAIDTALTSILVSTSWDKPIKTLAELRSSGLKIYVTDHVADFGFIPESLGLSNQYVRVHAADALLIEKNNSGAIVTRKETAIYYITKYVSEYGRPIYSIVDESLVPGVNVYTLQKNSPYLGAFDKFLKIIMENGLEHSRKGYRRFRPRRGHHHSSLNINMSHLAPIFLCFGYVMCFTILVFFLEIVLAKFFN